MFLEIFDKYSRIRIDMVKVYDYVSYSNEFVGRGRFELRVPLSENSIVNLTEGNYILFEKNVCGIIKKVHASLEDAQQVTITGFLTKHFLEYRSFLVTTQYHDYLSNIAIDMVNDLIVNPEDDRRKIDFVSITEDSEYIPETDNKIRIQNTGDTLLNVLSEMVMPYNFGFDLLPILSNYEEDEEESNISKFEFRVLKPNDRTVGNIDGNVPVVFSFELDNLNSFIYEEDGSNYRNIAIVASEGQGVQRHIIEVGDDESEGIDRLELYVDARDLQSELVDGTVIDTEELEEKMIQRGYQKLSETQRFISVDGTINSGDTKYIFEQDFFLGDYVTIMNDELNKQVNVQITEITKSISSGIEYLDITFGYDRLSVTNIFNK